MGPQVCTLIGRLLANGQLDIVTGGLVMTDKANAQYYAMLDQLIEGNQCLNGTLGMYIEWQAASQWAARYCDRRFGHDR